MNGNPKKNKNIQQQQPQPQLSSENVIKTIEKVEKEEEEDPEVFKEVFNISENIFTYKEAEKMCKKLNCKLATYKQILEAQENGANWCNYGWSKGQKAYYPIQKDYWEELQNGPNKDMCGVPGVNGGNFDPSLKFGVNCYGVKPKPDPNKIKYTKNTRCGRKNNLKIIRSSIKPFSDCKWSEESLENSIYDIDNKFNINNKLNNSLNNNEFILENKDDNDDYYILNN